MLRIGVAAALSALLLAGGPARAGCAGSDLMAALAERAPETRSAILARGRAMANGQGRLWRVTRDEVAPSHLFGTVHSTMAAESGLPPPVRAAFDAAERVVVELGPAEQARLQARLRSDPGFAIASTGKPLSARLSPEELVRARAALASRGVPATVAERMKPWLLISMMAVPLCEQRAIAQGGQLLDQRIAAEARAAGKPVIGLETYEEAFAAFEALTPKEVTRLLVDSFAAIPHEEDLQRTLLELYRAGEIGAIMEFNIWFSAERLGLRDARATAQALQRDLLAGRNRAWLPGLVAAIEQGGAFAAFGALHLVGREGIVALLRDRGYTVEQVPLD